MTEGAAFGLELRRLRERRGLSLDQLADTTKISGSLFAGLERGDLSRWPTGIFRRAFVRSYAQAVGADAEDIVARFVRLFPEVESESPDAPARAAAEGAGAADTEQAGPSPIEKGAASARGRAMRRSAAAAADLAIAAIPAVVAGAVFGWQWFFVVAAAVGALGHLVAVSAAGATPGSFLFLRPPRVAAEAPEAAEVVRRRPDAEPQAATSRRRLPRHASSARPVAQRTRHVQH